MCKESEEILQQILPVNQLPSWIMSYYRKVFFKCEFRIYKMLENEP